MKNIKYLWILTGIIAIVGVASSFIILQWWYVSMAGIALGIWLGWTAGILFDNEI